MLNRYTKRRQRLQKTLLSVIGALILFLTIDWLRPHSSVKPHESKHFESSRQSLDQSSAQSDKPLAFINPLSESRVLANKSDSVLSTIEFVNPPYLNLNIDATSIVPIMVLSKASHIEVRDAIRRTWAFEQIYPNQTKQVKIFFLVGIDDYVTQRIRAEQLMFDDIIQASVPEMNAFLAYKELAALLWVRLFLKNTSFYLKTEDDVILNTRAVIEQLIPTITRLAHRNLVIGWFGPEHAIQRGTYQIFLDALFPPTSLDLTYAMSLLYAVTSQAADRMLDALSHVDQIDQPGDIFLTGFLRDAAQVQTENLATKTSDLYSYELANGACKEAFENNSRLLLCTSSLHEGVTHSVVEYFDAWNTLINLSVNK